MPAKNLEERLKVKWVSFSGKTYVNDSHRETLYVGISCTESNGIRGHRWVPVEFLNEKEENRFRRAYKTRRNVRRGNS